MEGKTERSTIQLLTDALAAMTERAVQLEKELEAAKKDADNWYQIYCKVDEHVRTMEKQLAEKGA